jgi:hypothetical protein
MLGESAQIALKLVQLADARLDLLAMALNQLQDVSARAVPASRIPMTSRISATDKPTAWAARMSARRETTSRSYVR